MVISQEGSASPQHPDALAAVVLHTLVTDAREGMSVAKIALACERDPNLPTELHEIEVALLVLLDDGLAVRGGDGKHEGDDKHEGGRASGGKREGDGKHRGGGKREGDAVSAGESEYFKPTRAAIRAAELSF